MVPSIHRRGGRASSLPSLRTEADSQLPDSRPLCLSPAMLCTEVSLGSDGAGPSYMACGHPEQHGGGRISYLGRRGERLGSYRTTEGRPGKRKGCFSLEQHDTGGRGFYASLPERWVQASVCKWGGCPLAWLWPGSPQCAWMGVEVCAHVCASMRACVGVYMCMSLTPLPPWGIPAPSTN